MANYLVTGGAGFIGSNITRELLKRGHAVRVLDNLSTGRRINIEDILEKIDFIEGDIRNPDTAHAAAKDMDYILHQAAIPSVPRSVKNPIESLEVSVLGTAQILLAARDAKVRRVVYAASSSMYGDQKVEMVSEELIPRPLSPYASAKLTGEQLCSVFNTCYGLETVSLRYFNVFGPAQDPNSPYGAVIPLFIRAIYNGEQPTIEGDGLQTRDFTFVQNNVEANLIAATSPKGAGMAFNIACGGSYSIVQLLDCINQAFGAGIQALFAPSRVGDVRHSCANIALAREVLGYNPVHSFEDGIRITVEWYKEQRAKGTV